MRGARQARLESSNRFEVQVEADLPTLYADVPRLETVIRNLIENSIKYTQENGEITVFISKKDGDILSQISDSGFGIPVMEQSKIFQKFFRATNIVKHETEGTGLGLYLAKSIIESSGGKIWFKSDENKVTSFWFSLPISGMKAKKGEVSLD